MLLIIMRGVSCSGKSTIARELFGNLVLSSDDFRQLLTGDVHSQHQNALVFDMLRAVLKQRMFERSLVAIDATNIKFSDAKEYFELASEWGYRVIVLNVVPSDLETHLQRNEKRKAETGFHIPAEAIAKQLEKCDNATEFFKQASQERGATWLDCKDVDTAKIEIASLNLNKPILNIRIDSDKFEVYAVGDVHGCMSELQQLIDKCQIDSELNNKQPKFIMLGDYIDRGPESLAVLHKVTSEENIIPLLGNHEWLLVQEINGKECRSKSRAETHEKYKDNLQAMKETICNLPAFMLLSYNESNFVLSHGPMPFVFDCNGLVEYKNFRQHSMQSKLVDLDTLKNCQYKQPLIHVHGHMSWKYVPIAEQLEEQKDLIHKQLNIDSGCVYGGQLTAIRLRDLAVLQVQSKTNVEHDFI